MVAYTRWCCALLLSHCSIPESVLGRAVEFGDIVAPGVWRRKMEGICVCRNVNQTQPIDRLLRDWVFIGGNITDSNHMLSLR